MGVAHAIVFFFWFFFSLSDDVYFFMISSFFYWGLLYFRLTGGKRNQALQRCNLPGIPPVI
jgi:hypothetical protein